MTKILSGLILFLILVSCYRSAEEPTFNMNLVIPADSMVILLTDVHLADGILNTTKEKDKSVKPVAAAYFDAILQKHNIDRATFEESMRYYAFHTEELDNIYERVIIDLNKIESKVQPEIEVEAPAE